MNDDREYPDVAQRQAERNELTRRCAISVMQHHRAGLMSDPHKLQWARGIVSRFQPLGRPLSDGTPAPEAQQ